MDLKSFCRLMAQAVFREYFNAKIAVLYLFKRNSCLEPVFVLGDQRTGSGLLASYLNSHPEVSIEGEVLSSKPSGCGLRRIGVSKEASLAHVRHVLNCRQRPVGGAKIFFSHLEMRRISLMQFFENFPQAKWLVLYRRNILDQYISLKVAAKTRRWYQKRGEESPDLRNAQIELSFQDALEYRDQVRGYYQSVLKVPGICRRSLWISYEEFSGDPQELFDKKIFPFLELAAQPVQSPLVKQNIWRYSELLTNYKEVQDLIERTDFTQSYEK